MRKIYFPLLLWAFWFSACFDPLVGEECAQGYSPCGEICVPVGFCSEEDAGADALEAGTEEVPFVDAESVVDTPFVEGEATMDGQKDSAEATVDAADAGAEDLTSHDAATEIPLDAAEDAPLAPLPPEEDAKHAPTPADAPASPPSGPEVAPLLDTQPVVPADAGVDASADGGSEAGDALSVAETGDGGAVALADVLEAAAEPGPEALPEAGPEPGAEAGAEVLADGASAAEAAACVECSETGDTAVDLLSDAADGPVDVPLTCAEGLTSCSGACVNTKLDANHCGGCNLPCANGVCSNGVCEAPGTGRVVVIGHDYFEQRPAMNRVLANAVFYWPNNPVELLVYEGQGNATAILGAEAGITQMATSLSRQFTKTVATAAQVPTALATADVFLINAQETATDAELVALSDQWKTALIAFVDAGGTVILLDAVYPANSGTYQILVQAGLFTATARAVATDEACSVSERGDALSVGVSLGYGCKIHSARFVTSEAIVVIQASSQAVVIHKVF